MGKRKKENDTYSRKKNSTKTKQCYHDMISADGKGTLFTVKLKLQGTSFYLNKYIEKEIFKKELMNLIQTNHQINMISDHSVSTNNSFKSHFNSKSFNMFLTL